MYKFGRVDQCEANHMVPWTPPVRHIWASAMVRNDKPNNERRTSELPLIDMFCPVHEGNAITDSTGGTVGDTVQPRRFVKHRLVMDTSEGMRGVFVAPNV